MVISCEYDTKTQWRIFIVIGDIMIHHDHTDTLLCVFEALMERYQKHKHKYTTVGRPAQNNLKEKTMERY